MSVTCMGYFRHPWLRLELRHSEIPYECNVCRQLGFGPRYQCPETGCNFQLHEVCSWPRLYDSIFHPFFPRCDYKFYFSPLSYYGGNCQACGKNVLGCCYYCHLHGHYLHPVCANLPLHTFTNNGMELNLSEEAPTECFKCRRRVFSDSVKRWSYVYRGQYSIHAACLMEWMYDAWRCSTYFQPDANRATRDLVLHQPAMYQTATAFQYTESSQGRCGIMMTLLRCLDMLDVQFSCDLIKFGPFSISLSAHRRD